LFALLVASRFVVCTVLVASCLLFALCWLCRVLLFALCRLRYVAFCCLQCCNLLSLPSSNRRRMSSPLPTKKRFAACSIACILVLLMVVCSVSKVCVSSGNGRRVKRNLLMRR